MDPMHGTVGVAPADLEARSSLVPDAYGGNMDTPEMRAGVTCYLGVNVEGALSRSGTGTAGRARARRAASPWRPRWTLSSIVELIKGWRRRGHGWSPTRT